MELNVLEDFSVAILAGIISNIVYGVLARLTFSFYRRRPLVFFHLRNNAGWLIVFNLALAGAAGFAASFLSGKIFGLKFDWPIVLLATLVCLLAYDRFCFFRLGLRSAEKSVKSGTDYKASLDLATNGFWFLGTGAYKLTHSTNFEATMRRCNRSPSSVRFLLSRPDNPQLEKAEATAGAPKHQYARRVEESLQILKQLKENRAFNFEVRFYKAEAESDIESLRMMFLNDSILLLSYNAYGEGDGSDLPQLIIFRSFLSSSKRNFFFPYFQYYERLWKSADPWDFVSYVQ